MLEGQRECSEEEQVRKELQEVVRLGKMAKGGASEPVGWFLGVLSVLP